MKKILIGVSLVLIIGLAYVFTHEWFSEQKDKVEKVMHPEYEKIDDARGVLDKILEHISETNPGLTLVDGELVDSELGLPHYEVVGILELAHFDEDKIVSGCVVRPVVTAENPKMLIVVEAADKAASVQTKAAMDKVKSDQYEQFTDAGMWTQYLIDENKIERQGNFLLYATWEDSKDLVKIFQRYVQ